MSAITHKLIVDEKGQPQEVILSLLHNPKTPVGVSLGLGIANLTEKEVEGLARDRNIPAAVSRAARKRWAIRPWG